MYLPGQDIWTATDFWHQQFERPRHYRKTQKQFSQKYYIRRTHSLLKTGVSWRLLFFYLLSITLHSCLQNSRFLSNGVRNNFCSSSSLQQKHLQLDGWHWHSHFFRQLTYNSDTTSYKNTIFVRAKMTEFTEFHTLCKLPSPLQEAVFLCLLKRLWTGAVIPLWA